MKKIYHRGSRVRTKNAFICELCVPYNDRLTDAFNHPLLLVSQPYLQFSYFKVIHWNSSSLSFSLVSLPESLPDQITSC
ncbi:hypothetical protein OLEAN_C11050 [Oleispira antarctica RB-8]|uniref:Uncharacterized protein n=1 Tax=Oleispira antarctica RB-8 TaxID=698738 RepID=R4YKW3_OLEAN|nr:hypothetical protein OLEAN_C11050 [Oleispira antarctica RB-8]